MRNATNEVFLSKDPKDDQPHGYHPSSDTWRFIAIVTKHIWENVYAELFFFVLHSPTTIPFPFRSLFLMLLGVLYIDLISCVPVCVHEYQLML